MIPNEVFNWLMEWEGGAKFTDDPDDMGGPTKYGLSKRANPDLDIENLTEVKANILYELRYWRPASCNVLPPYMQLMQFNASVNCGPDLADRILQRTLGVKVDGVVGRKTLDRLESYGHKPKIFTLNYSSWLMMHYLGIVIRRISQKKWARGWFRRTAGAIWFTAVNYGKKA